MYSIAAALRLLLSFLYSDTMSWTVADRVAAVPLFWREGGFSDKSSTRL